MMLGCSKNFCILSYLMNWVMKLSLMILFFSTTFKPTINPVSIYLAK